MIKIPVKDENWELANKLMGALSDLMDEVGNILPTGPETTIHFVWEQGNKALEAYQERYLS